MDKSPPTLGQGIQMARAAGPLVSIVTASLNAEKYIEQSIASVRSQDYPAVEHIIVDGKSTDGTVAIIMRHEKEYALRWISERDQSPDQAVNKGVRMAKGELVGLLGSDDIYLPWTVGVAVNGFRRNPEADLVYGDLVEAPFGERFGKVYFNPSSLELSTHLRFNSIGSMAVFFRKRVFEALGGFDETLQITGDYDFWVRAVHRFKCSKVDEVLGCFRYRRGSKSIGDPASLRREKAIVRARYPAQTSAAPSLEQIRYYLQRVIKTTGYLAALLVDSSSMGSVNEPWRNLRRSGCISRTRLVAELGLSPILSTNNPIERAVRHGSVNIDKLAGLSMDGMTDAPSKNRKSALHQFVRLDSRLGSRADPFPNGLEIHF